MLRKCGYGVHQCVFVGDCKMHEMIGKLEMQEMRVHGVGEKKHSFFLRLHACTAKYLTAHAQFAGTRINGHVDILNRYLNLARNMT